MNEHFFDCLKRERDIRIKPKLPLYSDMLYVIHEITEIVRALSLVDTEVGLDESL